MPGHALHCHGRTVTAMARHHDRMPLEYDPDSSDPKWRQILAILREGIEDGTYQPGRPLPSIERLRQEYGIARNTARKILDALVDEGRAYTEPSKGTYVNRR